jgi:ribosome-associated protein
MIPAPRQAELMPDRIFHINEEFITLGQLLKVMGVIGTGGEARWYLSENAVYVNGESEARRGRKLRNDDVLQLPGSPLIRISGPASSAVNGTDEGIAN